MDGSSKSASELLNNSKAHQHQYYIVENRVLYFDYQKAI